MLDEWGEGKQYFILIWFSPTIITTTTTTTTIYYYYYLLLLLLLLSYYYYYHYYCYRQRREGEVQGRAWHRRERLRVGGAPSFAAWRCRHPPKSSSALLIFSSRILYSLHEDEIGRCHRSC